jgi:tetratricopeptide (TPR) repeat protein
MMQQQLKILSNSKSARWLDTVEAVSVIGSIGGAVAASISQQALLVSVPLSLSVALNLANRKRLLNLVAQENQTAIVTLNQKNEEHQVAIAKLDRLAQENQTAIATLNYQDETHQIAIAELNQQLEDHQRSIAQLNQFDGKHQINIETLSERLQEIQQFNITLDSQQKQISDAIARLQEIENYSQAIRTNSSCAELYYQRGLIYERLENKQIAIEDYTQAIRLEPSYALVYYRRGILYAQSGQKKKAIEDFRQAAKFYFQQGDINNYQKARDAIAPMHQLNSNADTPQTLLTEGLFA